MRKLTLLFATVFAVALMSVFAFAQENQIGAYFKYVNSDAQQKQQAVGGGVVGIYNLPNEYRGIKFTFKNEFGFDSNEAGPLVNGGRVWENTFSVRSPLGLSVPMMDTTAEVYLTGGVSVLNQRDGSLSKTQFNPQAGVGFKTGDLYTEYNYVISPNNGNSLSGHKFSTEYYRPLSQDNPKWNVFGGVSGLTARFEPLGPTPGPEALMKFRVYAGISKKY